MASDSASTGREGLGPGDWATDPERRYAERQAALADHYGVDCASRTVGTDSAGRVHYLVAGDPDGDPVVLLHGVGTTAATWLPMLPSLTDGYRVYAPDRPGIGLSEPASYRDRTLRTFLVEYLVELLEDLGVDRPHVVGNSLGGQQAALLALDHDRVDRQCFVGAPGCVSRAFPLAQRLLTVRGANRLLYWLLSRGDPVETARGQVQRLLVADDSAVPEPFYELLAASSEMPDRVRSLRSLQHRQGSFGRMHPLFDLRAEMVDIERPTGFVWGSEDAFFEPSVGRPVAERMPDAGFVELPDHGHVPWLEPDEQASGRVRSFLDGEWPGG